MPRSGNDIMSWPAVMSLTWVNSRRRNSWIGRVRSVVFWLCATSGSFRESVSDLGTTEMRSNHPAARLCPMSSHSDAVVPACCTSRHLCDRHSLMAPSGYCPAAPPRPDATPSPLAIFRPAWHSRPETGDRTCQPMPPLHARDPGPSSHPCWSMSRSAASRPISWCTTAPAKSATRVEVQVGALDTNATRILRRRFESVAGAV